MKVTRQVWSEKMQNLNDRRAVETIKNSVKGVDDYTSHIKKCYIGSSVLDVGCGSQIIKESLQKLVGDKTYYLGIDPFPSSDDVIKTTIEEAPKVLPNNFDTAYCFAALDNVIDFYKAIESFKKLINVNIVFLTGVNIEPDKYHTIKITEELLVDALAPEFGVTYQEYLHPKIWLVEFTRIK